MADGYDAGTSMLKANPAVQITEFRGGGFASAGADYSTINGVDAGGDYTAVGGKIDIPSLNVSAEEKRFMTLIGLTKNAKIVPEAYNAFLGLFDNNTIMLKDAY